MPLNVAFIGAGNVAWHLAPAFENIGIQVSLIHNRTRTNGIALVKKLYHGNFKEDLDFEENEVDILFLCVPDDSLEDILEQLEVNENTIVVHTSGTQSIETLKYRYNKSGVFYPLQTFSKTKRVDFADIPILVEGSDYNSETILTKIAKQLSKTVKHVSSEDRKHVHLAAVFACNFTNHMLTISEGILKNKNQSLDILYPLISETINKALAVGPQKAQTGPARRQDLQTLEKHITILEKDEELSELYRLISQHIIDTYSG